MEFCMAKRKMCRKIRSSENANFRISIMSIIYVINMMCRMYIMCISYIDIFILNKNTKFGSVWTNKGIVEKKIQLLHPYFLHCFIILLFLWEKCSFNSQCRTSYIQILHRHLKTCRNTLAHILGRPYRSHNGMFNVTWEQPAVTCYTTSYSAHNLLCTAIEMCSILVCHELCLENKAAVHRSWETDILKRLSHPPLQKKGFGYKSTWLLHGFMIGLKSPVMQSSAHVTAKTAASVVSRDTRMLLLAGGEKRRGVHVCEPRLCELGRGLTLWEPLSVEWTVVNLGRVWTPGDEKLCSRNKRGKKRSLELRMRAIGPGMADTVKTLVETALSQPSAWNLTLACQMGICLVGATSWPLTSVFGKPWQLSLTWVHCIQGQSEPVTAEQSLKCKPSWTV